MPLDVRLARNESAWSTEAAYAFRHGIQDLEDHLMGMGIDDAELEVRVRTNQVGGDIHAMLRIGADRLDANGEDLDLAYGLTQVLERLRELASPQRVLIDDGRGPPSFSDAPWEDLLATVVAMATHLVTRAVDLGDLPAGVVDPRDLADDALVDVLEERDRSMRAVRQHLRAQLERRISAWSERTDDVELDAARVRTPSPQDAIGDEAYQFRQPDAVPEREGELLDPQASLADDDRTPRRPDE